jgi:signal transduction histidine kinase
MDKTNHHRWNNIELPLSVLVFFLLLWFTYGILIKAPYAGFDFNGGNGQVAKIITPVQSDPPLQVGDTLVQVGPLLMDDFHKNRRLVLFENVQKGEIVEIIVDRNGEEVHIPWQFPGFTQREFYGRFFNIWWLAYFFWLSGFTVQVLIRPKDVRWQLFIASNYLTGLWLILGSLSTWQLWGSSILLHAVTWLLLPVYLHLNWEFPRPLGNMPKALRIAIYVIGFSFAMAEVLQVLPYSLYALAFLTALLGSIILEAVHFIRQKDQRRNVVMLTLSILIALTPSIGFGVIVAISGYASIGPLALLALPFMPVSYIYIIYRRQLGGLELRANRIVSTYAFLILLGTLLTLGIVPITFLSIPNEIVIFLTILISSLMAVVSIVAFPAFQAFVDQRIFGIKLPYQNLQEVYSNRITAANSISDLLKLLEEEVFPSLLVRQYAFLQVSNGFVKTLLHKNIDERQVPVEDDIKRLILQAGKYVPGNPLEDEWTRLILPLKAGDASIGFWLLGRRDPDDMYSLVEIPILQSLANQTAIALSNIRHAEQLKTLYQSDVDRYEKERMRLALELHDSVLNELAILRTNTDEANISPKFQASYDEATRRLREIVMDLRPPMLSYGLKPAIEELADNLMERSKDTINITVDLHVEGEARYAENIEQHIYRVVQEACGNAVRHARATLIQVSGALDSQKIFLKIQDNGIGFEINGQSDLDTLVANNHFGLTGMAERVRLIDGEVNIRSTPQAGTSIQVTWVNVP